MSELEHPRKLRSDDSNLYVCRAIGVRFNGKDTGKSVRAYDLDTRQIEFVDGNKAVGYIELYWRPEELATRQLRKKLQAELEKLK